MATLVVGSASKTSHQTLKAAFKAGARLVTKISWFSFYLRERDGERGLALEGHQPSGGGITSSNSLGFVRFQIFLMTARSSLFATSRSPTEAEGMNETLKTIFHIHALERTAVPRTNTKCLQNKKKMNVEGPIHKRMWWSHDKKNCGQSRDFWTE